MLIGSMEQGPWALNGNLGVLRLPPGSDTRRYQTFASTALVWSPREVLHLSVELIANADATAPSIVGRCQAGWARSAMPRLIRLDAGGEQRLGAGSAQAIVLGGMTFRW
ncbi:MAG: hypothetical protein ABIS17_12820 [Casimicrobiaceae bacterium]